MNWIELGDYVNQIRTLSRIILCDTGMQTADD